jgi:predicted membrane channel-forming protein YqfA (hemolysin III family)
MIIMHVSTMIMQVTSHELLKPWQIFHLVVFASIGITSWALILHGVVTRGSVRGLLSIFLVGSTIMYVVVVVAHLLIVQGVDAALVEAVRWGPEYCGWATGFIAYYLLYPERIEGDAFAYVGNSHNIFHILVVASSYSHFCTLAQV